MSSVAVLDAGRSHHDVMAIRTAAASIALPTKAPAAARLVLKDAIAKNVGDLLTALEKRDAGLSGRVSRTSLKEALEKVLPKHQLSTAGVDEVIDDLSFVSNAELSSQTILYDDWLQVALRDSLSRCRLQCVTRSRPLDRCVSDACYGCCTACALIIQPSNTVGAAGTCTFSARASHVTEVRSTTRSGAGALPRLGTARRESSSIACSLSSRAPLAWATRSRRPL
jgi:hypothetical protein